MGENRIHIGQMPNHLIVKDELPLNDDGKGTVRDSRNEVNRILSGESNKKLLIIGPCSADFKNPLEEYASFINEMRERYREKIEIVMRFYTGKPRTILGWKGLNNARPGEESDIVRGIMDSRELAIHLIENYKIPLADEMLHPQYYNMFRDIYTYLAIGARTTEGQGHREVASGAEMAVGFKNPVSGDLGAMMNGIMACRKPSNYNIMSDLYLSIGNPYSHGVLRGGRINDINKPNYDEESLKILFDLFENINMTNPAFLVDTNHENSNKKYKKQIEIMISVFDSIEKLKEEGIDISRYFKGFMTESYLLDGRQDWPKSGNISEIQEGLSLTDPCIGLERTRAFIDEMYRRI